MKYSTRKIVSTAILAALSSILFMIEIPVVLFYKLDLSNVPVLIGTFAMGPLSGIIILFIKSVTGLAHSGTAMVGEFADFVIGLIYVIICSIFYNKNKTKSTALIAMLLSTIIATVISVAINKYILIPLLIPNNGLQVVTSMAQKLFPFVDTGNKFLWLITAPYNIIKGIVITLVTFILYKRLSIIIHKEI